MSDQPDGIRTVSLPSGAVFYVHDQETNYFNERVRRYESDNKLTNISDQQDLDRIVMMELLSWRYGKWIGSTVDYWGDPVDDGDLLKQIKEMSIQLKATKASLGIDKVTRDKQRGEDSIAHYLDQLRQRARQFGYTREKQMDKAMELFHQLKALITLYRNSDEVELQELKCDLPNILQWLEETAFPEFDEIDEYFRQNEQQYWIRKQ